VQSVNREEIDSLKRIDALSTVCVTFTGKTIFTFSLENGIARGNISARDLLRSPAEIILKKKIPQKYQLTLKTFHYGIARENCSEFEPSPRTVCATRRLHILVSLRDTQDIPTHNIQCDCYISLLSQRHLWMCASVVDTQGLGGDCYTDLEDAFDRAGVKLTPPRNDKFTSP
jgi:hypothetical protein